MRGRFIEGLSKSEGAPCTGEEELLCPVAPMGLGERWPGGPPDGGRSVWLEGVVTRGGEMGSCLMSMPCCWWCCAIAVLTARVVIKEPVAELKKSQIQVLDKFKY